MSKTPYKFNLPSDLQITELEGVTEKNHIATSWEISKTFMFGRNNNPPDVVYYQDVSVEHRKKLSFNVEDVLEQNKEYWVHAKYHTNVDAPNARKIEIVAIINRGSTTVNLLGYQDPVTGDVLTYGRELIFDIEPGMRIDYLRTLKGFVGGAAFDNDVLVRTVDLNARTFTVTKAPKHSGKFVFTLTECISTDWSKELRFDTEIGTWAVMEFNPATANPDDVTVQATNTATFNVVATISDGSAISYQWQERNQFNTFVDMPGETGTSLVIANTSYVDDDGRVFRCKISSIYNQEKISNSATLTVTPANITITVNPNDVTGVNGSTATFNVTATLDVPGTLVYQWQKRELNEQIFNDVSGANSATYTTAALNSGTDSGDSYRCKVTNVNAAAPVFSEIATIITYDYDMYVSPAITSGLTNETVNNWIFAVHGPLIIDAHNFSTRDFTLIPYQDQSRRIWMWGEGRNGIRAGYSTGSYNFVQNQNYLAQVDTGGGDAGTSYGWVSNSRGGGYAGLFTGTSASQSNALMIAGGAGGTGFGHGSSPGGTGGGQSGSGGTSSSDTQIGSTGGGAGTQSSGGNGGGAGGSAGSGLQGGRGGDGQQNGYPNAGGGGGGGGGWYGGGGGGGGNDNGNSTRNASGGGGGSGYIHSTIVSGVTGVSSDNQDDNQGSGGNPNSRIVIESAIEGPYTAQGGIAEYPVLMSNRPDYGWYTRSGGPESTPTSGVRQLVILWAGNVIYDGNSSVIAGDGTATIGAFKYIPGTYRSPSPYGWASNGTSSGTQSPPNGDFCNSFDISREG